VVAKPKIAHPHSATTGAGGRVHARKFYPAEKNTSAVNHIPEVETATP
jgi:hypothetical protein